MIDLNVKLNELFNFINNLSFTARAGFPYRSIGMDNSDDPIGKFGDEVLEYLELKINDLDKKHFCLKLDLMNKEIIQLMHQHIDLCKNKPEALKKYVDVIDIITNNRQDFYADKLKNIVSYVRDGGILVSNIDEIQNLNQDHLLSYEIEIIKPTLTFIHDKILVRLENSLLKEQEILLKGRLKDWKVQIRIPSQEQPLGKLNLYKGMNNFEINYPKKILTYKVEKLYELLTVNQIITATAENQKSFMLMFKNERPNIRIGLTKFCTKGFFKLFLGRLHKHEIIQNKDYIKVAELNFFFEEAKDYDWNKLRKTTATHDKELLDLVEKCVNLFL